MGNSFKARLFGALFGSSLIALFMIIFRPYDSVCIPVSFLGGIIGAILGALISNVYLNRPKTLSLSVNDFRDLGFFLDKENISDDKLAEMINEEHFALFGEEIDPHGPFSDLILLSYDKNRVWWEDTEADVLNGNNVYIDFMNDLSKISMGVRVLKIAKVKLGVLTKLMGSSVGDGEVLVAANSTGLSAVEQVDKRDKPPIIRKLITLFIFPFQIYISF